jgi:hypothetical protein
MAALLDGAEFHRRGTQDDVRSKVNNVYNPTMSFSS